MSSQLQAEPEAEPRTIDGGGAPAGGAAALRRRAVRGGGVMISAQFAAQVVSWAVTVLVMRFLRPADYGVVTAGAILLGLADRLSALGIGAALVRKPELEPTDADEAFTLSWLLSLAMYALVLAASVPAGLYFRNPAVPGYLQVAGLVILLTPFRSVGVALVQRQLRMERIGVIQVVTALLHGGVVLALAVGGYGYWALVVGTMAARIVEAAALLTASRWRPRLRRLGQTGSYLVRFGVHATGSVLLWHAYSNMDYMILGRVADPVVLGYYTLGFTLMTLPVDRLTTACVRVAYPVLSRLQHEPRRMWDWYLRLTGIVAFFALPALAGMVLVAPDAVPLVLGAKWRPAILSFQILSLAGGVMAVVNPLTTMLNILNRPDLNWKYALTCLVVMAPAFWVLGTAYGATGIALTWAVLFPILALGRIAVVRPVTGLGLGRFLAALLPALRGLAVMVPVVLLVRETVGGAGPDWVRLAASIAAGAASYAAAVLALEQATVLNDLKIVMREARGR
jgi:O-antigen/teichoic acid export membrane protein